jgi:hypothetical protein
MYTKQNIEQGMEMEMGGETEKGKIRRGQWVVSGDSQCELESFDGWFDHELIWIGLSRGQYFSHYGMFSLVC